MAYGLGGAIAQGLESGFQMGRQVDADRAAKEQRAFENARQTAADARAQQAADMLQTHNALAASKERLGMLATEGAGLAQQYGGDVSKIPVDVQTEYAGRAAAARRGHEELLNKLAPVAQDWRQSAQDDASKMSTGQLDPLDPKYPPAQLVHTLTATARRPLQDFMPQGDRPAPVTQMVNDFRTGLQTGNEGMTLKALNGLFAPELKTGVGQPSPHGGVIVGKQVVKLLPAPSDPNNPNDPNAGKVTPVLRVFVREGPSSDAGVAETRQMANIEQQRYGAPPGATGHYDAPVTQNRSTDPNDPIAHISMEDAMNRIGQMETLVSGLSDPALRAKVDQGLKDAGTAPDAFLQALYSIGGKMPTKQETYENVPIGTHGTVRITKNAQGKEIGREVLAPTAGTGTGLGPLGKKLADIDASDLTDAEKDKAKRVAAGLVKVKAGGAGGGGAGAGGAPAGGLDPKTVDFYATQSIAGDNSWQVGLARGKVGQQLIAAVKDRIPAMAADLGLSPQDVGTNKAQNAALAKTLADRQKYVTSVEQLTGTLTRQGDLVKSLLAKGGATEGGPLFNKPLNALKTVLGDSDFAQLQASLIGLAREHQRVLTSPLSNAQLHASAQETGDKLINANMPPKTIVDIIDNVMKKEAQNGLEQGRATLEDTRAQLRGLGKAAGGTPKVSAEDDALINKYLKR
jgi:hypothetical protein